MIEKNLKIALAESMTCGLATHQLNIVKGTSEILKGGVVCYNEKVKIDLLNVRQETIRKYTAESQEVSNQLANNLGNLIKADIYASVTGLAISDGSETKEKPVGTAFFAIKTGSKLKQHKQTFNGAPLEIKKKSCEVLYKLILEEIS